MTETCSLAAEYYIASLLLRKGYILSLTLSNFKKIDMFLINKKGTALTIDVKGIKNKTNWPMRVKREDKKHFFVFVTYKNKYREPDEPPEIYVVPSKKIKELIGKWSGSSKTCVAYKKLKNTKYKDAWKLLEEV